MATNKTILPWYFGNTTVRSPFRLRDGLLLISTSALQGNLHGAQQEIEFCKLLGKEGIVNLRGDDTYSVARKWRSALSQHGFLYPKVTKKSEINQSEIGQVDTITPNGWNLIRADTVAGMQECFLRSMASFYIPNALEVRAYSFETVFSPLRHILKIMLELERITGSNKLDFLEIGLIVIWSNSEDSIESIVTSILRFRDERNKAERKRKFDQIAISDAASKYAYASTSFADYADLTIRYLKATGLVQAKGRGITLVPEKHLFIEQYTLDTHVPTNEKDYIIELCNGAKLPTDNETTAKLVLADLVKRLKSRGEEFDLTEKNLSDVANLNIVRHEVEDKISVLNEIDYAKTQAHQWKEISTYMDLLINNGRSKKISTNEDDDSDVSIPQGEAPAYFEWIIWRAFLAINSLINPPNDCRKFKIDQDFLPVGTAPGGGPDLVFEFEKFVVVAEVTLTTSSRQEAAEGEPVRRHVANVVNDFRNVKPVFGLFLANKIDSNTAETFRLGTWYTNDDEKMRLDVVPLPLTAFKTIFDAMFTSNKVDVVHLSCLLNECVSHRSSEAPLWKLKINDVVDDFARRVSH